MIETVALVAGVVAFVLWALTLAGLVVLYVRKGRGLMADRAEAEAMMAQMRGSLQGGRRH